MRRVTKKESNVYSTYERGERLLDQVACEPGMEYAYESTAPSITYISPFRDQFFKKIFASETSKEILKAFLNSVIKDRVIDTLSYGKNEYPGEIESERGAIFDVSCTDTDGTTFLVEVQQGKQGNFKERSLFYAGRFISDQAPKGDPDWGYDLKEIYVVCLLADFSLADSKPDTYRHHIALNYKETGEPFYDKLEFIYLEVEKFKKAEDALNTALDQWIYALKYAEEMKEVPLFLNTPELDKFFYLAKYSNLTKEERDMYRTKEDVIRDNRNKSNFAWGREEGREEGALAKEKEIAIRLKAKGIDLKIITEVTGLSIDEIIVL